MSRLGRRLASLAALAGALACPAAAGAAEMIVVGGGSAERVEDPFAPSRAESDLGPAPGRARPVAAASSRRGRRAVHRALRRALRARRISRARYRSYLATYRRAASVRRRLRGARRRELGYVLSSVERLALSRRLIVSRMPVVFLQLKRNTEYWPSLPFPAPRTFVSFRGSELVYEYFRGRGLQLHPLNTFKRANLLHGACAKPGGTAPCQPGRLRRLLDEMSRLAVRRARGFIAWEYLFHFGGGSPPFISAIAQAQAVAALARAAQLLERPAYVRTASRALGAFATRAPVGVLARGPFGGPHYLHYSFAPRFYVFNGIVYTLVGLHDYAKLTGDERARHFFRQAEPEVRREVPYSDVGDWSRYSFRGRESTPSYHELLREALDGLGGRVGGIYRQFAQRYRAYQTEPAALSLLGPQTAVEERRTRVVFSLSKLSAVEITILKGDRVAFHRIATFRRGGRAFAWRPRSPGLYTVRLGAKELRTGFGLRSRDAGELEVQDDPER